MTYTESKKKPVFNWIKALSKNRITKAEWSNMQTLSESWVTCSCGVLCERIPRDEDGVPEDRILTVLGGSNGFHKAISNQDKEEALHILNLIEQRAEFLLSRIPSE